MTLIQTIWYMWNYNQYLKTVYWERLWFKYQGVQNAMRRLSLITDLKLSSIKLDWKIIKNTTCFILWCKLKKNSIQQSTYKL